MILITYKESAMKQIFILIIIFITFSSCNSKIKKKYYESGELKVKAIEDNDGLVHGKVTFYYKNGAVKEESEYVHGKLHGLVKGYFPDGQLKYEEKYEKGRQEGIGRHYFQNGKTEWEQEYAEGVENGKFKEYNEDGKLVAEANFKDGKINGVEKHYFLNGNLKEEIELKNGNIDGKYNIYYENGMFKEERIFENNRKVYAVEYDSSGEPIFYFRKIDVKPWIDTVFVGDKVLFNIKINGPVSNEMILRVGILDGVPNKPVGLPELKFNSSGEAVYRSKVEKPGHFYLNAQFYPFIDSDRLWGGFSELIVLSKN